MSEWPLALTAIFAIGSLAAVVIAVAALVAKVIVHRCQSRLGAAALQQGASGLHAAAAYQRSLAQVSVEGELRALAKAYQALKLTSDSGVDGPKVDESSVSSQR